MKSRTEILVPFAAIQAVPIAVIAWYRLQRYAWYRYSAIVKSYIADRLKDVSEQPTQIADEILAFTSCHPYYTQQLSFAVWNNLEAGKNEDVLQLAIEDIITTHDLDYERLWLNFNKTDKYVMVSICEGNNPAQDRNQPTSTMTSALLRLSKKGYIIRSDRYEIEDPFFRKWILKNMIE